MQTNGCLTNKHFQNEQALFVCSAEIWATSAAGDRQKVDRDWQNKMKT